MATQGNKRKGRSTEPMPTVEANGSSYPIFTGGRRVIRESTLPAGVPSSTKPTLTGLDPATFAEEFPVGNRPNVPALEEEIPQKNVDNSIFGKFTNLMDNIWPDDLGGMLRGKSDQWIPEVPYASDLYRNTIGRGADVLLTGGAAAVDAINWGSEQMNHLGAALVSWLPGGIQTLDWEQSQDVSFGQALVGSMGATAGRLERGQAQAGDIAMLPFSLISLGAAQLDTENIAQDATFDILDAEQRKEAFESGGLGQTFSGVSDAIWLIVADPTIVGGKATLPIRFGTKVSTLGGYTNRPLRSMQQIDRFATDVTEQGRLIQELGVDGARSSGRIGSEGEYLISAMEGKADDLANHPWVKGSSDKRAAQSLLAETSLERPGEAAALAGAMAGNPDSWATLRSLNADLYEATAMAIGINPLGPIGGSVQDFATAGIRLTDDQINLADDIIYERLSTRPDLVDDVASAGQLLITGGARKGPRSVRAANAWRSGAARQALENNAFRKSSSNSGSKSGHFVYDMIEGVSGSMPLRVVRWLGQGTPNGIVYLKDGPESMNSLDEFGSWLRKSPMDNDLAKSLFNEYALARTVQQRKDILQRSENLMVEAITAKSKGNITPEQALAAYNGYKARRAAVLESAAKSENNFFIDPVSNEIVKVPGFYAELDQAFPLLNVKEFSRVTGNNPAFRYIQEGSNAADYLNSLWKVSVLARLGYTQRNILEGALRSFAVLGVIAANPRAWGSAFPNAKYYAKVRRGLRKTKRQEKMLLQAQTNLNATRALISSLKASDSALDNTISQKELAGLLAREKVDIDQIDQISANLNKTIDAVKEAQASRRLVGRRENIMADGVKMRGAFQDAEGSIALKASSADNTTYLTFDGVVARRYDKLRESADFKRIDPEKLTAKQLPQYFDELAIRFNYRYRSDPVGRMILENRPVDDIVNYLKSERGSGYRRSMELYGPDGQGRLLRSDQQIRAYVDQQIRRLNAEVPMDTGLRQKLLQGDVSSAEIASAFGSRKLPPIVGRIEDGLPPASGVLQMTKRGIDKTTSTLMRYLGTVPEDKLLRHPFYNSVYTIEQRRMYELVQQRALAARAAGRVGPDMSDPLVKARINRAAHRIALKSTRQTMYTIDRLSNAAMMLRFVSPFFPAFENSVRTWGRIVWTNPAIVGEANILWNIPNNLGWVVDENGNRQGEDGKPIRSSFLRDEGHYIIWPEAIANIFKADLGPFTPGEAIRTRQSAMNVIFPGGNWWFPGVGPATAISTAWFLKGKPEDAEILKRAVGEEMFRELVPMGAVQGDILDAVSPTIVRRLRQMLNGESTDSAYLSTWNQIIEDEYIQAQLEDRTLTESDMEKIRDKANRFWAWQIGAAAVAPAQSTIQSRWQVQRDAWQRLLEDTTLSYQEKIRRFRESFDELESDDPLFGKGDSFMAITRTGSYSETKLRPNLTTWARIVKNKDIVDGLYRINPELVGMFGNMGSFDDPFSYAVYGEYSGTSIGADGNKIRRKLRPDEIIRNNEIADGWSLYWKIKDEAEERVIQLGYSSLEADDAKDIKAIVDQAAEDIAERYPAWGEERRVYQDKLPDFILGARRIVENAELLDEDSTVRHLAAYLEIRDEVADALADEKDQDKKSQIRQIGYAAAFELRQRDIGFADFYDQYLYRDDFRRL